MSTATSVVKAEQPQLKQPIGFGDHGVRLSSFEDAYRFSKCVVESGWAPRGMEKPEAVLIALQHGAELGLPPMAALQNIAVINGRPGIYGDAALALVRGSGLCEFHKEEIVGTEGKDDYGCKVTTKRKGMDAATEVFTVGDAKRATLWSKAGPWTQYPKRMLRFRARGFSLRDNYGDVLKGLRTIEELQDMPREQNVTPRPAPTMAQILGGDENRPDARPALRRDESPVIPSDPASRAEPVEYTDAQREQFIAQIEAHILDTKTSERALRVQLSEANIATDEEFSLTEQPTAVLAEVGEYCAGKSKVPAGGAA